MYDLIGDRSLSDAASIIRQWETNRKHGESVWDATVMDGVPFTTKIGYLQHRRDAEIEVLQKMWDSGDKSVKKVNGKWNHSKVVCAGMRSAKSIISNCIDKEIPLVDIHGKPWPKTKLETALKNATPKPDPTPTTEATAAPMQYLIYTHETMNGKAVKYARWIADNWDKIDTSTQREMGIILGECTPPR